MTSIMQAARCSQTIDVIRFSEIRFLFPEYVLLF